MLDTQANSTSNNQSENKVKRFLANAISTEINHFERYGKGAIYDLGKGQHGWDELVTAKAGDRMAVIKPTMNIPLIFEITEVKLDEDFIIVFGKPVERVDMSYQTFVRKNNITNSKIDEHFNMRIGFNVASW